MTEALAVILLATAATYVWRALGVALAGRLDPSGRWLDWVGCVAYALLAGLVMRLILLPSGALAETTLAARLAATAIGLATFFTLGQRLLPALAAGTMALMALSAA